MSTAFPATPYTLHLSCLQMIQSSQNLYVHNRQLPISSKTLPSCKTGAPNGSFCSTVLSVLPYTFLSLSFPYLFLFHSRSPNNASVLPYTFLYLLPLSLLIPFKVTKYASVLPYTFLSLLPFSSYSIQGHQTQRPWYYCQ